MFTKFINKTLHTFRQKKILTKAEVKSKLFLWCVALFSRIYFFFTGWFGVFGSVIYKIIISIGMQNIWRSWCHDVKNKIILHKGILFILFIYLFFLSIIFSLSLTWSLLDFFLLSSSKKFQFRIMREINYMYSHRKVPSGRS